MASNPRSSCRRNRCSIDSATALSDTFAMTFKLDLCDLHSKLEWPEQPISCTKTSVCVRCHVAINKTAAPSANPPRIMHKRLLRSLLLNSQLPLYCRWGNHMAWWCRQRSLSQWRDSSALCVPKPSCPLTTWSATDKCTLQSGPMSVSSVGAPLGTACTSIRTGARCTRCTLTRAQRARRASRTFPNCTSTRPITVTSHQRNTRI